MTVFTVTASSPLLRKGRTALIPILYILGGEHVVHSAVGDRLSKLVKGVLSAEYSVPVRQVEPTACAPAVSAVPTTDASATQSTPACVPATNASTTPSNSSSPSKTAAATADTIHAAAAPNSSTATPPPPASGADGLFWSTAAVRFLYLLRLCGDFGILAHFLTLTDSSDVNRCPYRWPCLPEAYLSMALLASASGRARDSSLLPAHWELVVWGLSRWCTLRGGLWRAVGGRVLWACPQCKRDMVAHSTAEAALTCASPSCPLYGTQQARVLPEHAYTPLSTVYRLLRRHLGGTRGYPLLLDIPLLIQAPVFHCTGKIAKSLMYFLLALLSQDDELSARTKIYALLGRSNLGAMYLREFGRVVAMVVSLPGALGEGVTPDTGVVAMMKLSQLLTASWRRAIGARSAVERERAAAALQLAAALLSPLYAALKSHDPVTKKAGVFNLYLHTTLAHVRQSIGKTTSNVLRFISDDHIEGKIAELNRYFNRRTNNVSRGQSLVNKEALIPPRFDGTKGALTAERMLFTREILLCRCVVHVAPLATDDYQAAVKFSVRDAGLSFGVAPSTCSLAPGDAALVAAANAAVATAKEAKAAHVGAAAFASATAASSKAALAADAPQDRTENAATAAVNSSALLAKEAAAAADVAIVAAEAALVRFVGLVPLQSTLHSTPDVVRPNPEPDRERSMEGELQSLL